MLRRVLIADDEPLGRERNAGLVRRHAPGVEVREVGDGASAVEAIRTWAPQALLLDVQMPALDGFGVLRAVGPDRLPPTIFITAHDMYAIQAFDVAAVDYLLKPFDDDRFAVAWQRLVTAEATGAFLAEARRLQAALAEQPSRPRTAGDGPLERLMVTAKGRTYVVRVADARWFESAGNYVAVHTPAGRHLVRETLAHLERRLDPARFVRIHRRRIVSLDAIRELQPWFAGDQILVLTDGSKLRVSRSYRARLVEHLGGTR